MQQRADIETEVWISLLQRDIREFIRRVKKGLGRHAGATFASSFGGEAK